MINEAELKKRIQLGEDSYTEFKKELIPDANLVELMVSFLNLKGGWLIFGVDDKTGSIVGLNAFDKKKITENITNICQDLVKPFYTPVVQSLLIDGKNIIVVEVPEGNDKPYANHKGEYWVRAGASNRRLSRDELKRIFIENSGKSQDELPYAPLALESLDEFAIRHYLSTHYSHLGEQDIAKKLLAIGLMADDQHLNLAGALLLTKQELTLRPDCVIKAVAYKGNDIADSRFLDQQNFSGSCKNQLESALAFCKRHLSALQQRGFNDPTQLEIHPEALEEILVNAMVHRDYGIRAPVRLFIFSNRLELISPGNLPNHLNTEKIRTGNAVQRNPILASHASRLLPYRGLGSGIPRVIKNHPDVELIDDIESKCFKILIQRK